MHAVRQQQHHCFVDCWVSPPKPLAQNLLAHASTINSTISLLVSSFSRDYTCSIKFWIKIEGFWHMSIAGRQNPTSITLADLQKYNATLSSGNHTRYIACLTFNSKRNPWDNSNHISNILSSPSNVLRKDPLYSKHVLNLGWSPRAFDFVPAEVALVLLKVVPCHARVAFRVDIFLSWRFSVPSMNLTQFGVATNHPCRVQYASDFAKERCNPHR